jgi:hypothetical protein
MRSPHLASLAAFDRLIPAPLKHSVNAFDHEIMNLDPLIVGNLAQRIMDLPR